MTSSMVSRRWLPSSSMDCHSSALTSTPLDGKSKIHSLTLQCINWTRISYKIGRKKPPRLEITYWKSRSFTKFIDGRDQRSTWKKSQRAACPCLIQQRAAMRKDCWNLKSSQGNSSMLASQSLVRRDTRRNFHSQPEKQLLRCIWSIISSNAK